MQGRYRTDLSPATTGPVIEVAQSTPEDVELALDAAHAAKDCWADKSAVGRSAVLLMAAWKLAPALAAGNCTVLKPTSPTPWLILKLAEVIEDVLPSGVINIVARPGGARGVRTTTPLTLVPCR